ncbi:MAG: hypothetical protein NZ922_06960 [Candidatus Methanomethyliaceae archaeon]|nr:hypothetical protein [Candidatus Methanomethyliaceae archaeon]MDW7971548.1 hypothetical protein [Nitrososphaerota archaeon]
MKWLLFGTIVGIIAIILIAQFWPTITPIVRHVNPKAEIERLPLPSYMMTLVLNPFNSLIMRNYTAVENEIKILSQAYIPDRYKFIIDRFNNLLSNISNFLAETEDFINKAEELIYFGSYDDAKELLMEASFKLTLANITYLELKAASEELAKSFNLPLIEIKDRLNKIAKIIELLYEKIMNLLKSIEKQKILKDSFIIIDVQPRKIWTGGNIEIEGRLYAEDHPLSGKIVQIYLDGIKFTEALTLEEGIFKIKLNIPYIYKPKISIQARYIPYEDQPYKPSSSNIIEVELIYIEPRIIIDVIGDIIPGKSFLIKGIIENAGPYDYINISWAGLIMPIALQNGKFSSYLKAPLAEGLYPLKIEAPSHEIYAPAQKIVYIKVNKLPLNVKVIFPSLVVAGFPSNIEVLYEGEKLNIKAIFAGQVYSSSGNLSISAPLTALSGYYNCEVYISSHPWYKELYLKESILIINPLTLFPPILIIAFTIRAFKNKEKFIETIEVPKETIKKIEERSFISSSLKWLIELYWRAVSIISKLTGIEIKPSMTMREYLALIKLDALKKFFEILTIAAEKALYSKKISNEELNSARKAFEELNKA